jgi:hypothetical protein
MKPITFFLSIVIIIIGGCITSSSPSTNGYQMTVDADSIHLYDGNRYIGSLASSAVPELDSLIIEDNR